ncbi:MAG: methionyl-tRNA formyltransferase [Armatimonadia bacterium]
MRVLFFGTPSCAVPYLQAIERAGGEVVGVITQPDRPRGRSGALCPPPVKEAATARQFCVLQPPDCRDTEFLQQLADLEPDILLVVAFGRILCPNLLAIPRVAALNVHYSLLPAFRGAAPVQHALLAGLEETGVTLQHLAQELDAGDIVAQATLPIAEDDNTATLTDRLTQVGVDLVQEWLPQVFSATAPRTAQDHALATLAPRLSKADGRIAWERPAVELWNLIRAVSPWPGAVTAWRGRRLLVRRARVAETDKEGLPGHVIELPAEASRGLVVATGAGALEVLEVQPAGKQPMPAADWLRGARLTLGDRLESVKI